MHLEILNNGMGGPSMYMMVLAGQGKIPAAISITADTGWEDDCLLSTGERVTAKQFYNDVIEPLGGDLGVKTYFVRGQDKNGIDLVPIGERLAKGEMPGVPTYGSRGGQLNQACTGKYKVRPIRQQLRRLGATTARSALGLTMDEVHRMKQHNDVKWHSVYWPLIDFRLYRATIQDHLEKLAIPYIVSSQCDGCPHQDYSRWQRLSEETIIELAEIEAGLGGTQFLTDKRIPLLEALERMKSQRPEKTLFDICDSGYCFT